MKAEKLKSIPIKGLLFILLFLCAETILAQTGITTGLASATSTVKGTFNSIGNLVLAIGGIVGLVGGIRVYIKWQNGDQDINKHIVGWAGSAVFLLLVGTVLKSFFGM